MKESLARKLSGSAAAPADSHGSTSGHGNANESKDAHADDHGGHHDTLDVDIVLFLFMCLLVG